MRTEEEDSPRNRSRVREDGTARILGLLEEEEHGLSISDISRKINLNRSSVAKYLGVLVTSGRVEMRAVGSAKVYLISSRPSVLELFEYIQESVIIVGSDLKVYGVNPACCGRLDLSKDIVGKVASHVSCPFLESLVTSPIFSRTIRGAERVSEIEIDPGTGAGYLVTFIPVTLFNGQYGVAITLRDVPEESGRR